MLKLIFMFFLFIGNELAIADEFSVPEEHTELFLNGLSGAWDGKALETPVGRIDYDIRFYQCQDGVVAGVAETGASMHYWYFFEKDGDLHLRFLSTFAGNKQPIFLVPSNLEGNILHFEAPELALLTVSIEYVSEQIDIRIFHYKKPHVHIRLKKANALEISDTQWISFCETLPDALRDTQ